MKRVLASILLIGTVGCGDSSPSQSISTAPTSPPLPPGVAESTTTVVTPPPTNVVESLVQTTDTEPVAALEKLGVSIERNELGEVVYILLTYTEITDEGLVHL